MPTISVALSNAAADLILAALNGGRLTFYTAPQRASPDAAVTTQTPVCSCAFADPAFGPAAGRTAAANAVAPGLAAAPGVVTWAAGTGPGGGGAVDFSVGPVSVVTARSLASGVATLTTRAAHGFSAGAAVAVSGLADAAFNGAFTVTAVPTPTTFTFALAHADVGGTPDAGLADGYLYDINLASNDLSAGQTVAVASMTVTHP